MLDKIRHWTCQYKTVSPREIRALIELLHDRLLTPLECRIYACLVLLSFNRKYAKVTDKRIAKVLGEHHLNRVALARISLTNKIQSKIAQLVDSNWQGKHDKYIPYPCLQYLTTPQVNYADLLIILHIAYRQSLTNQNTVQLKLVRLARSMSIDPAILSRSITRLKSNNVLIELYTTRFERTLKGKRFSLSGNSYVPDITSP